MHTFITIIMVAIAILSAAGLSLLVLFSDMMSDAPQKNFPGLGLIVAAWIIAALVVAARVF